VSRLGKPSVRNRAPVTLVRADIAEVARRAAGEMQAFRKQKERRELSGDDIRTTWETAPTIAVLQRVVSDGVYPGAQDLVAIEWETLALPHNLETIRVRGTKREAVANGWTLHELLKRRLHRVLRNRLAQARIFNPEEAARRAKLCEVYVADSHGLFDRGVQKETTA